MRLPRPSARSTGGQPGCATAIAKVLPSNGGDDINFLIRSDPEVRIASPLSSGSCGVKRSELGELTCSLAGALAEVGDAWSLLIVKELMLRNRRFDGIAAQTGVSDSSLAARLKRLERCGILERSVYRHRPIRYEYRLTTKGEGLWPALVALTGWGDRWQGRATTPLAYGCVACGVADARPHLACEACGTLLDARSVNLLQSDDMRLERGGRAMETSHGRPSAPGR